MGAPGKNGGSMNDTPELTPCSICEKKVPDPVDAIDDHKPVKVCRGCYEYETGETAR